LAQFLFNLQFINIRREVVFYLKDYGLIRIAVASNEMRIADVDFNLEEILRVAKSAVELNASVILFPELAITGYSCADLFFQSHLLDKSIVALTKIAEFTENNPIAIVVGLPLLINGKLFNVAAFVSDGEIIGFSVKTYLPNYNEFYEKRWFASADELSVEFVSIDGKEIPVGNNLIYSCSTFPELKIGIEICEDLWAVKPISSDLAIGGANVILNPSAGNELIAKKNYRTNLILNQSARTNSIYAYANASAWESSTDLVFSGHCLIAENGELQAETERFSFQSQIAYADCDLQKIQNERLKNSTFDINKSGMEFRVVDFNLNFVKVKTTIRKINPKPFQPTKPEDKDEVCNEILKLQSTALARRLLHTGLTNLVLGISGGLDSTLALIVCIETMKKIGLPNQNIIAISMPGFGTSRRTKNNAKTLAETLKVSYREISIVESTTQHLKEIGHNIENPNVIYENAQARRRTHILMDIANEVGGIVVGTGDLSEIALGWNTYNADHISMYNVNSSIPKTLVRTLIEWYANKSNSLEIRQVLYNIINTPISPELLPNQDGNQITQETEEIIGPYLLHDFFLYHFIRNNFTPQKILFLANIAFREIYDKEKIEKTFQVFIQRFFQNQFKRSCFPDGVKVGSVSLSPRGDWRMPSDASSNIWK